MAFLQLEDWPDMQTELAPQFIGTPDGTMVQSILSKCVHCGFCTATCPTYQLLGDELDEITDWNVYPTYDAYVNMMNQYANKPEVGTIKPKLTT